MRFWRRRLGTAFIVLALALSAAPRTASAGFFDFLFGDQPRNTNAAPVQPSSNPFSGLFGDNSAPAPTTQANSGRGAAFCVRACDGKYFPLTAQSGATPAQLCQSFCPASPTKVFFGGGIEGATAANGERYIEMPNAFAYRKALKADCTCNGRDPAGLAPVDLSLDTTLRPGDVVATSNGLVAYSGVRTGSGQTAEFTPVANYPGLTADIRAKLGEMKVAPVAVDVAGSLSASDTSHDITGSLPPSVGPQNVTTPQGTAASKARARL